MGLCQRRARWTPGRTGPDHNNSWANECLSSDVLYQRSISARVMHACMYDGVIRRGSIHLSVPSARTGYNCEQERVTLKSRLSRLRLLFMSLDAPNRRGCYDEARELGRPLHPDGGTAPSPSTPNLRVGSYFEFISDDTEPTFTSRALGSRWDFARAKTSTTLGNRLARARVPTPQHSTT